ncbi:site-specific DNA-methyltransferase [uncultured Anaerococcus sp.]|uniref:site-specific DNA-methyltransferase n=1 Tax=uncultured Anaerococcus sp. TaxID=293428 RepID=UPI0026046E29|nr:site-specific DNA-methyltransferase [uncultured Anaerococcus sp.]
MKEKLFDEIIKILKSKEKYVSNDGEILKAKVYEDVLNMDKELIEILLSNEEIKENYFVDIDGILVFDKQKFAWAIDSKEFLPDSYTAYTNKIGLTSRGNFISQKNDVVLDFPYKDCVLEGGQDKDDQKRKEIFYNETLASSEIRRMLDPKVFTKAKRYTKEGLEDDISFNEDDNLIIKGNNLIALTSLLKRYDGKVKCIYIDPPYNTNNDTNNTFKYNNNFNHSTWLTFMKNRLEVAKKLLIPDEGAMIIAIDENEQAYLGVLLDELFNEYESHMITIVHNPRGIQGTNFSYTNEFLYFVIPKGKKIVQNRKLEEEEIEFSPLRNWGSESLRTDAKNCFYPILVKNGEIVGFGDVVKDDMHPRVNETIGEITYIYPIDIKKVERKWRYARNSVDEIKHLLRVFDRQDGNIDIQIGKDFGQYKTVWIDKKYDSNAYGKQWLNKIVDDKSFSFPKSIYAVKDAIFSIVANDKKAIVLDFFGGSGTSAEAVSIINSLDGGERKFIIVEQMDYIKSITLDRIVKSTVIDSEKSTTVYCELMENGNELIREIENADEESIKNIKEKIYKDERIIPYITTEELEKVDGDFEELSPEDKKKALVKLVDKNKLYVNYSDIDNADYDISEADKKFTESFYEVE